MSWNQNQKVQLLMAPTQNYASLLNIRDIDLDSKNFKIRGLVLSKSSIHLIKFNNESGTNNSMGPSFKAVFNFTIRDSVTDFINITSWGMQSYSKKLYSSFHIGDVVSVSNVAVDKPTEKNSEYRVQTSIPFILVMNEKVSGLELYFGPDRNSITSLQNTLLHPMTDHVSLLNVIRYLESLPKSQQIQGQHFTFLAIIHKVGEPTDMLSKTQKDTNNRPKILHKLDVVLMDESCRAFPLIIWDLEWITFIRRNWIPKVTVVSLVDCKVKYDDYKRGMCGLIDQRTVSIQNPEVIESHRLHNLISMQEASSSSFSQDSSSSFFNNSVANSNSTGLHNSLYVANAIRSTFDDAEIPLSSIQNVANVKDVLSRSIDTDYVIVYGTLTSFPIDDEDLFIRCIWLKCKNCMCKIQANQLCCTSIDCPMLGQNVQWTNTAAVKVEFNTMVSISDHTGTINKCILSGQAMNDFIMHTPEQILNMSVLDRAQIKWNLFLNRYKFYIKNATPSFYNSSPFTKILGVQIPTGYEIMASVK